MHVKRFRELSANAFFGAALAILLGIAAVSALILNAEKSAVLDYGRVRTDIFARRAAAAVFPKVDRFALHFLVNTLTLDGSVTYALVMDQSGRVLSHSVPERIGENDPGPAALAARTAGTPLSQAFDGPDGRRHYYFSNPVVIGRRRVGTAALAIDSRTLSASLADTRQKLLFIFAAAALAVPLLWRLRAYMREERRAADLKSAMVHTVSHEFNNALTVIDAAVFMLEETEPLAPGAQRLELYRTLEFERMSLRRYVKNILNEARMEAGRFKVEMKELALRDLAAGIVYSMEGLMRQKELVFSLEMPPLPVLVLADKEAMSLVISNLIGNAVKYTPRGGRIVVRLAPDSEKPGWVTFYSENSGRGLKSGEIEKLREEFYRTEDGKAAASGFGLGLRITNEMLLLHGSRLEISGEEGKCSRFYFSLPAVRPPGEKENPA